MPHAKGRIGAEYASGASFTWDNAPHGFDTRGGFFLTSRKRGDPEARGDKIDLHRAFGEYVGRGKVEFDYTDADSGGEYTAGYIYEVTDLTLIKREA